MKLICRCLRNFKRSIFQNNPVHSDGVYQQYKIQQKLDSQYFKKIEQNQQNMQTSDKISIYQLITDQKFQLFNNKKQRLWRQRVKRYLPKTFQLNQETKFDRQTNLPINSGFDSLIKLIKDNPQNSNTKYIQNILGLAKRLNLRNQVDFLRQFKRALTWKLSQDKLLKLKGQLLKKGIQLAVVLRQIKSQQKSFINQSQNQISNIIQVSQKMVQFQINDIYFGTISKAQKQFSNPDISHQLPFQNRYQFAQNSLQIQKQNSNLRLILKDIQKRYINFKTLKNNKQNFSLQIDKKQINLQQIKEKSLNQDIINLANQLDVLDQTIGFPLQQDIAHQLQVLIWSMPIQYQSLLAQNDQEQIINKFFSSKKLSSQQLIWDKLPLQLTIDPKKQDFLYPVKDQYPNQLSYNFIIQSQLSLLPFKVHKHPLKNIIRYYAQRVPNNLNKKITRLQALDPDDRCQFYRKAQKGKIDIRGIKTNKDLQGKAFGGGGCKKSSAMAYIKPNKQGRCLINNLKPYQYFYNSLYRAMSITPIFLANMQSQYEIRLYVKGGGARGKAQACSNALARAIIKLRPELKSYFRHQGLITLDKRNKERKHINLYKARLRYPYVRR